MAYVKKLHDKVKDNAYMTKALGAVEVGVNYASQTFVDALKAKGSFLDTDWGEAMQRCITAAKAEMGNEVLQYIEMTKGDATAWIERNAEALLKKIKGNNLLPVTMVLGAAKQTT